MSGQGVFDAPLVRMVRALTKNSVPHVKAARIVTENDRSEWREWSWSFNGSHSENETTQLAAITEILFDFWVYAEDDPENIAVGMAVDWKEDIQEIGDQFSFMVGDTSGGTIDAAEIVKIYDYPKAVFDAYGPVPVTIASLYSHIGQPNFQLLQVDTGADYYLYTIVSDDIYRKWAGFVPEGEARPYLYYGLWQAEGFVEENFPSIGADQLDIKELHNPPLFAGLELWDAWRGGFK